MSRLWAILSGLVLLSGCGRQPGDMQVRCVADALVQPELSDGVAVFSRRSGGVGEARAGFFNARNGDSTLDMASLTKPLVAAEVRRRIFRNEMALNQSVQSLLPQDPMETHSAAVTVGQLLQHRGGFDRDQRDPLFENETSTCHTAALDVLQRRPEWVPGTKTLYSNAGYCVLGEILLAHPGSLDVELQDALHAPLGAAGGWRGSLRNLHAALSATLPLGELEAEPRMPDGSHYAYAWRRWPDARSGPRWTHFGRLPGLVSLALTDGEHAMLVAHFTGDPPDVDVASKRAGDALWRCMSIER